MLQQTLTSNRLPAQIITAPLTLKNSSPSSLKDGEEKGCKHRNENGWCSKSQRQCLLISDLFFKH